MDNVELIKVFLLTFHQNLLSRSHVAIEWSPLTVKVFFYPSELLYGSELNWFN